MTAKFVEAEIARQAEVQSDDGLEADRADAFIARALAETQRMSKETKKSEAKLDKLRNEFGTKMINDWGSEHAAEALSPSAAAALSCQAAAAAEEDAAP